MAGEQAVVSFVVQDEASGPAAAAASSLQNLKSKIEADTAALRNMQAAMKSLQGGAQVDIKTFQQLQQQISAKRAEIASSTSKLVGMEGAFNAVAAGGKGLKGAVSAVGDAAKKGGADLGALLDAAKSSTGPLGGMIEKVSQLTKGIGQSGWVGAIIVATIAVLALAGAVVFIVAKMAQFALTCSDAARSQNLLLQGLTGNAKAAGDLGGLIDRVSARVAVGKDKVSDYAKELYKAGLRGAELEAALEATAIKASVMGDSAASDFLKTAKAAKDAGDSVTKLSNDVKTKLGPIAQKQMLSMAVQTMKLKENLAAMFGGVKIDPFLKSLQEVLSVFDQTTASGKALKALVEVILDPLFGATGTLGPIVKKFFQGMIIGALLVAIAVLQVKNAISDMLPDGVLGKVDWLKVALYAGVSATFMLVAALVVLTGLLALIAVAMFISFFPLIVVFAVLTVAILAIGAAIYFIYYALAAAIDYISGIDLGAVGQALMQGLSDGINAGAAWVMSSIKSLASNMKGAIMSALGIASPSKVFAEFGANVSMGMAQGVDETAPAAQEAVNDMVGLPGGGSPISMPGGIPGAKASTTNNLKGGNTYITIKVDGAGKDSTGLAQAIRREIETIFEGGAIEMGAQLEPEAT